MSRYRKLGFRDEDYKTQGDVGFVGVDMKSKPWLLKPGYGQSATNKRFETQSARTRNGTITPVFANLTSYGTLYGSGIFSDPNDSNAEWILKAVSDGVWLERDGRYITKIPLASGLSITDTVDFVQGFGVIIMLRGEDQTELQWDGDFYGEFEEIDQTGTGSTNPIPNSDVGLIFKDRLIVKDGRDELAVSDVGNYTRYDDILQEFKFNSGSDDEIVMPFPYTDTAILVFKDQSIYGVDGIYGDLSSIRGFEVSRSGIGAVSQFCAQKWGDKVLFMSTTGVWAVVPVTNQDGKLAVSDSPVSDPIQPLIDRINWREASRIVSVQLQNYIYWAVPIDGGTYPTAMLVFNATTGIWEGLDTWDSASNFRIDRLHVTDWLGVKRIYAVDRGTGRTYILYENGAKTDVLGTTEYQISDLFRSRAYLLDEMGFSNFDNVEVNLATQNPSFTMKAVTDGVSEETTLCSARTKDRTKFYLHGRADFDVTNANGDFSTARRQDYWVKSSDLILSNSNFNPNLKQEYPERFPIHTTGRYCAIEVANTQGVCDVLSIALEGRSAQADTTKQAA